jgi:uncharacterized protein involved in exopolysaccharide biosynthesis
MEEKQTQAEEISLIDLFGILWQRKKMIITITVIIGIGILGLNVISILLPPVTSPLPNEYSPAALMLINNAASPGGSMASMLGASGLGGLAGFAGVDTGPTFSDLAIYLATTNTFLDTLVDEFDLLIRYKIDKPEKKAKSPRADSRKTLKKKLTASYDEKSGVLSISFTDIDPAFAQRVTNFCAAYLESRFDELGIDKNKLEKENLEKNIENTFKEIQNLEERTHLLEQSVRNISAGTIPSITLERSRIALELGAQQQVYTQLKVQLELLKVTMASEKPIFQVIELAEIPDKKSGPGRGMLCIIVTFAAGFFSVFLAFVQNAIANIKKDPEAMAKLRGSAS